MLVCWAIRSTSPLLWRSGRPGGATKFPVLPHVGAASGLAAYDWRRFCGLSLPGLVSLRRAVVSATGPLIRPGTDLLLVRGCLGAGCAGAVLSPAAGKTSCLAGLPGCGPALCPALSPDRREGPAVPRPPSGRPALPVTAPGGTIVNPISVTITGRLGDEPRTFTTHTGTTGVELRLALEVPARIPGADSVTRWVKVIAFGPLAERTAASVGKGDRVTVIADDLMAEAWKATSNGEPRARVTLRAQDIAASMAFDQLRTGYATRKAARAAAANGQPNDLPAGEQAEARVLSGVTTTP
jgi:single-stranded DNA-binding protein